MSAEAEEVEANDTGGDTVESRELQEALGRAAKARAECHSLTESRMRENLTSGLMRGLWR